MFERGKKKPPVIVKFVSERYGRKSWVTGKKKPANGGSIFLRKRRPVYQKRIKEKRSEKRKSMVTKTYNCEVKSFEYKLAQN